MESVLLTAEQAARYINRNVSFVRRYLRYETPYVQHHRSGPLYFRKSDLDMWIAQHTHVPAR